MRVCILFLLLNLPRPLCAWYIGRSNTHTTYNLFPYQLHCPGDMLANLVPVVITDHLGKVSSSGFCSVSASHKVKYFAHLRPLWVRQNSQSHISSLHLNKQNERGKAVRRWAGKWSPFSSSEGAALRNIGSCKRSTNIYFLLLHLFDFSPHFSKSWDIQCCKSQISLVHQSRQTKAFFGQFNKKIEYRVTAKS